jgi:hypothetical protein
LHLHHTVRQFIDPHNQAHLVPEFGQSNSRAAIIALRSVLGEAFFTKIPRTA